MSVYTTVVETDIHYPTDATLLWDTVRTVTRLVDKLHQEPAPSTCSPRPPCKLSTKQGAVQLGLEDGKQLRVDTTVVETDIHYPTDATLLWDTVRTVTRLVDKLHQELPRGVRGFTNRTRSSRRRMQALERMSATQRQTQQEPKYRELLRITQQVLESARQVVKKTAKIKGVDVAGHLAIDQLRQQITAYCDLGEKVINQTRRRVLDGEQVPPDEKVYSIFESHTHLIKRGKQRQPVEFGHKVFLAESSQGLITDYQILDGNPADSTQVQASL